MDFFSILALLGGLAIFLFGMSTMGEGLTKMSGGKLERVLETLTTNRFMAVLLGAGVTAVIQSSSTTTVMAVGFVNSGIMTLKQAIGIVMGSNIGTTITAWILSLSSLSSDNFFVQIFKPENLAPMLAFIGILLYLSKKTDTQKDAGTFLVGLGLLLFGMEFMKNAVAPLAEVPGFTRILTMFSNPLLGVLAGAVLTGVIQSSAASIGILQALCSTGAVDYMTAIPIIMGQNIGTCVTAIISGVGAKKNGKRVAVVHLCFNIIGVTIVMILFYSINAFVDLKFAHEAVGPAQIALIHSIFNIFTTIILFPFAGYLEKLACFIIRDDASEEEVQNDFALLDARFLTMPSVAIEQTKILADRMADISKETLFTALTLLTDYSDEKVDKVYAQEELVDSYEDHIGTYLMKLNARQLSEKESKAVSEMVHCIGDFERITDHALNIAQVVEHMHHKDRMFSGKAMEEINVFLRIIRDIVELAFAVFTDNDLEKARDVEPMEEVVDELEREIRKRHMKRLRKGKCTIELGFSLSDLCTDLERIADHCSNIAVTLIQGDEDQYDVHEYTIINKEDKYFTTRTEEYRTVYALPETGKDKEEGSDVKESKEGKEGKEQKAAREAKPGKEAKAVKEPKPGKEPKSGKENKKNK